MGFAEKQALLIDEHDYIPGEESSAVRQKYIGGQVYTEDSTRSRVLLPRRYGVLRW